MKISLITFILIFLSSIQSFSGTSFSDTTFSASLGNGSPNEKVTLNFNDSLMDYTLKIGSASVYGKFDEAFFANIEIMDIDKNDNYKEIVITGIGSSDWGQCIFYEYIDGKIVEVGKINSTINISTDGDKILKSGSWMGFWTLTEDFYFDSKAKTLQKKSKDTYKLSVSAKVKNPFKLLSERKDNSESAGTLKPGASVKITKADVSPTCKDAEGSDDSYRCHWYYMEASDGTEGWVRLRDFMENVDGLPWAG